jgi:pSer/pThr/pTyr-binding forkhead associated (FHA) protein
MRERERDLPLDQPTLIVRLSDGTDFRFSRSFHIGRDPECEVQIQDVHVSRRHAVVSLTRGQWSIRDLQSSNGLLVDGERVDHAAIGEGLTVVLGLDGPSLEIYPEATAEEHAPGPRESTTEDSVMLDGYAQRYFGSEGDEEVGGRTMMIRKAFHKIQQQQKRRYRWMIAVVMVAGICAGGYAYRANRQMTQLAADAETVFYGMKDNDLLIARIQQEMALTGDTRGRQQAREYLINRREMETNYEKYAARLYDRRLNEKDRLILRVTRMFGECELAAPPGYINEVMRYIGVWQSTGRFVRAAKLAQDRGYTKKIVEAFKAQNLPAQYFYLAMQESDFDTSATGKPTRWGIARGMWQFIPETGVRHGLTINPLRDDRLNWEKATDAAASYVKDIYATDAQASGLLVMASYNWGERRIIDLLRTMPADPRERNFWKLLEQYRDRMPPETYNYVFSIVSAAVIGENPKLFGFQIESPLKYLNEP